MFTFSPEALAAAAGPLIEVRLGEGGLPAGARAAARVAAPPARVWAVVSDVGSYEKRVPMIHRVHRDGDRVTVGLRFKVALFSVGFEFVADARREEESSLVLHGTSGEPRGLRLGFRLEPLDGGAATLLETSAEFDVLSLGWLAKYFLKHHPEIQNGIFPGVALSLLEAMRSGAEGRS
jgi:ribosome-associated toxin RatA of RatAB toxin-antitoxin module